MPRIEARLAQARVLLHSKQPESGVEPLLDEVAELVESSGVRLMAPLVLIERAELAHQRGQQDVRERHLEDARKLFIAMGATRVAEALART